MDSKELYAIYEQHPVITTDSRDCPEGSIFIALKGESFDGNQFAAQALDKGCAVAIVSDEQVYNEYHGSKKMILVPDTLQAYKDMAREHRRRFDIPVIAITGTNGKTTTKELVRAVLAERYDEMATEGNFNNDIGVPKTLFRLSVMHEIAVVEMGASHPGDIKTLAETAEPTCGLITNVGKAHLQGFGSLEGVIHTKGELYDNLAKRADNEYLMGILPKGVKAEYYTQDENKPDAQVYGKIIACDPFLRLKWKNGQEGEWHEVATHLIGSYNLDNVLAAVTVGLHFEMTAKEICHAIENYIPANNRSQLTETEHNHLVVDAYNANPTSMAAALDNFSMMEVSPKMAILGEMRELGDSSAEEFKDIDCPYRKFDDVEEVKAAIAANRPEGCYILIKGSNGTRLFQLPELL